MKRKYSDDQENAFVASYQSGLSKAKTALKHGVPKSAITHALTRNGIKTRTDGEQNRKYRVDQTAFDSLTEDSAYWIGFLMADGNITTAQGSPRVRLLLAHKDKGHVVKFLAFLKSDYPLRDGPPSVKSGLPSVGVSIPSKRLAAALARYGIVPRKSLDAQVIGLENNRDFWRGVIDGDGCICLKRGYLLSGKYASLSLVGSHKLVPQFAEYVRSICPLSRAKPRPRKTNPLVYGYGIGGNQARTVIAALYQNAKTALDRKAELAKIVMERNEDPRTCVRGHPFAPENRGPANKGRTTYCLLCARERGKKARIKKWFG